MMSGTRIRFGPSWPRPNKNTKRNRTMSSEMLEDLLPGVRYRLRSLRPTDLIPPVSGIYRKTTARRPIVSDRASNMRGFIAPKYVKFIQHETIVPTDELIPGQTYTMISTKDVFSPTKVIVLGFNQTMLFTDVDVGNNIRIPERLLESHNIEIIPVSTNFRYGFTTYESPNSSSSKNSSNSLGKIPLFKVKKTRRTRRYQQRTKSSRSRKYI